MHKSMNENHQKLVSVIMPAYNCEKYIVNAINSVLDQTYTCLELIIIDDGSKDKTIDIINNFCKEDSRVRLVRNDRNLGVSATRNRGISLANGEWIAFLDSDDIWKNNKIERQMEYAIETGAHFVFTGVSYINEKNEKFSGIFEIPSKVSYQKLLKQNVITCSSVLIKKYFFETIKMEKDEMHEDYAVWLRVLKTGIGAYGLNEPLLIYRISQNSKSGNKIKTIRMTYQVFRFIGINPIGSFYYMLNHVLRSVKKYNKIKN